MMANFNVNRSSLFAQVGILLRRQGLMVARDPILYLGRFVMFLFVCTFFSIIYVNSRKRVQDQVLYRLWVSLWFVGVPTNLGVIAVYAYNEEFFAVKKEKKNGLSHKKHTLPR